MNSVTASAPGRVNLIGEHLDYNGGLCLPIAIDRRTTATVRRTGSGARSSDVEPTGWIRYVDGVLAALGVEEPLDVAVTSTVPIGAGLSSSAALTCATAVAVDTLLNLHLTRDDLAQACIRAENEYVGAPTGGMDQRIALFGETGNALLIDFATGNLSSIPWNPGQDGHRLLVIDTRVQHALADGQYADRRTTCESAARQLAPVRLVDADEDLLAHLQPLAYRRARHVLTEQRRTQAFADAARHQAWESMGALLTASHWSLRDDYEVSCDELDTVVDSALGAGALGARMTGGGFGGSAIALVRSASVEQVKSAVCDAFAENGWEAPTVFPVEASRSASVDQIT